MTVKDLQNIKMMIGDKFFKDTDDFELASMLSPVSSDRSRYSHAHTMHFTLTDS